MKLLSNHHLLKLTSFILLLCISALEASTNWQLTLEYTKSGGEIKLLSAKQLNDIGATPGKSGALSLLPVDIKWLNASNQLLATTTSHLPLGLRVPPQPGSTEYGFHPEKDICVLRLTCPVDLDTPTTIEISKSLITNKDAGNSKITQLDDLSLQTTSFPLVSGTAVEPLLNQRLNVPLALAAAAGPTGVTKVRDTGDDDNRLVIVFVGDGYLEEDITSGKYASDVQETIAAFNTIQPWPEMLKTTNIYSIDTVSNERGADLQDKSSTEAGTYVDTYYNTSFYTNNIARLLYADSTGRSRANAAADAHVGAGKWDQIVMIVNSTRYGGAGGAIAVNSMASSGPYVSVHEVGHSFAGLADEYFYGSGNTFFDSTNEPNVDTNGAAPKWSHWVESGTPLPTTGNANSSLVGAWEGAKYADFGVYRPRDSCGMRYTGAEFCPVCEEAHLQKMFDHVSLIESATPLASSNVQLSNNNSFSVTSPPLAGISYQWYIDGEPIPNETSSTLSLTSDQLPNASQSIKVEASYSSSMMRTGQPLHSTSWNMENDGATTQGTPHWWLVQNGLNTGSASDELDHDHDGITTAQEYEANTNPNDQTSVFSLNASIGITAKELKWQTSVDRNYRIEKSTNLSDWNTVEGLESISGDGSEYIHEISDTDEKAFYKAVAWIPSAPVVPSRSSDSLGVAIFEAADIYGSEGFANNWATIGALTTTSVADGLQVVHTGGSSRLLDGSITGWTSINGSNWEFETRIKFNDITNGFALWLGTGSDVIVINIHPNRTEGAGGDYSANHTNNDDQFHTFRVVHDPNNNVYHLCRDDVLLTPAAGSTYDLSSNDDRLLLGDTTSASFGNDFDVTIDYVEYGISFRGNEIYDGGNFVNNWTSVGLVNSSLVNTDDLQLVNSGNGGSWIEGDNTNWSTNSSGDWTFEMKAQFNSVANGFILWLGTGSGVAQVAIYDNRTEDLGAEEFAVGHLNNDSQFHTYRVTHTAGEAVYRVYRDGVILTPATGAPFDTPSGNDLILGDYTSGSFGNNFDVTIDYINIDYTGAWAPTE